MQPINFKENECITTQWSATYQTVFSPLKTKAVHFATLFKRRKLFHDPDSFLFRNLFLNFQLQKDNLFERLKEIVSPATLNHLPPRPHPRALGATGTLHPSSSRKTKTLWITKITRPITNLLFLRVGFLNQFYLQQSVWTPRNPCLSLTTYWGVLKPQKVRIRGWLSPVYL